MKRSTGHIYGRLLFFLGGFLILFAVISSYYLAPMLEARRQTLQPQAVHPATQVARDLKVLGAYAWLLMTVLLAILIVGLTLVLRMSRIFSARSTGPHPPTRHIDAWGEAGKRLDVTDVDDADDAGDDPPKA